LKPPGVAIGVESCVRNLKNNSQKLRSTLADLEPIDPVDLAIFTAGVVMALAIILVFILGFS